MIVKKDYHALSQNNVADYGTNCKVINTMDRKVCDCSESDMQMAFFAK